MLYRIPIFSDGTRRYLWRLEYLPYQLTDRSVLRQYSALNTVVFGPNYCSIRAKLLQYSGQTTIVFGLEYSSLSARILFLSLLPFLNNSFHCHLAPAHLKSLSAKGHINETGFVVRPMVGEYLLDAGCCVGVFGNHIKVAATTGPGKFVAEAEIVY